MYASRPMPPWHSGRIRTRSRGREGCSIADLWQCNAVEAAWRVCSARNSSPDEANLSCPASCQSSRAGSGELGSASEACISRFHSVPGAQAGFAMTAEQFGCHGGPHLAPITASSAGLQSAARDSSCRLDICSAESKWGSPGQGASTRDLLPPGLARPVIRCVTPKDQHPMPSFDRANPFRILFLFMVP